MDVLKALDPAVEDPSGVLDANFWKTAYLSQPQGEEMKRRRGAFLADLACSSGSAPYVARGLLRNQRVNSTGGQLFADRLHKGKSDPTACPGVNGFTYSTFTPNA